MFGMIIVDHMNMTGDNICVKLRLFNKKIKEVESIRFTLNNEEMKEISNDFSGDEYSSQEVSFEELAPHRKYELIAECKVNGQWVECDKCYTSTTTHDYSKENIAYRTFKDEELPIASLNHTNYNIPTMKPILFEIKSEVI